MNIREFGYRLKDEVDKLLYSYDIEAETVLKEVNKDNGLKCNAIIAGPDKSGIRVSIYYDEYYDMYINGEISFEEAAQEIQGIYKAHLDKIEEINRKVLDEVYNWGYVKDKISFVLLNSELNRQYLKDMPNMAAEGMDDLCIIYKVNLSNDMSLKVTNYLLEKWEISVEELHEEAMKNAEEIMQPSVERIEDVLTPDTLKEIYGEELFELLEEMEGHAMDVEKPEMYLITGKSKTNGAGVILLDSVQKKLNELAKDREFFVIPSSKHEVIAIPDDKGMTIEEIKDMVYEVNHTKVGINDLLSNNIYKYNPASMEIKTLTNEPIIEERQHRINR